jgi:hypothetical protein
MPGHGPPGGCAASCGTSRSAESSALTQSPPRPEFAYARDASVHYRACRSVVGRADGTIRSAAATASPT